MKRVKILLFVCVAILFTTCSKDKPCYVCEAIGQGNTYHEEVCTSGDPKDKLPKNDNGGVLQWVCTER